MRLMKIGILLIGFGLSTVVYAIAPVVDAYGDANASSSSSSNDSKQVNFNNSSESSVATFSLNQRMIILEHQISNLNPLLVQLDELKQQIQRLQGKIEGQQHRLKSLEEQVCAQYKMLDKRIAQKPSSTRSTTPIRANQQALIGQTQASAVESMNAVNDNPVPTESLNSATVVPSDSAVAGVPTAASERAYQAAFQLLKNKQYLPAIEGFENFLKRYPADVNRSNAIYFLGQLYLLQGQPEQSITQFNRFVKTYALDARVPDALLQLGLAYFSKGEKTVAMGIFKKIIQQYPDSKAAQSAQARLQQFQAMMSSADVTTDNE